MEIAITGVHLGYGLAIAVSIALIGMCFWLGIRSGTRASQCRNLGDKTVPSARNRARRHAYRLAALQGILSNPSIPSDNVQVIVDLVDNIAVKMDEKAGDS